MPRKETLYITLKDCYEIVIRTRRGRKRIVYHGKKAKLGIPKDVRGDVFVDRLRNRDPKASKLR
jgi:hypothetical protein